MYPNAGATGLFRVRFDRETVFPSVLRALRSDVVFPGSVPAGQQPAAAAAATAAAAGAPPPREMPAYSLPETAALVDDAFAFLYAGGGHGGGGVPEGDLVAMSMPLLAAIKDGPFFSSNAHTGTFSLWAVVLRSLFKLSFSLSGGGDHSSSSSSSSSPHSASRSLPSSSSACSTRLQRFASSMLAGPVFGYGATVRPALDVNVDLILRPLLLADASGYGQGTATSMLCSMAGPLVAVDPPGPGTEASGKYQI
jgi:hypothetical protein